MRQAMSALRQEIGFYIADELFDLILAQANEVYVQLLEGLILILTIAKEIREI
jgi:hypothetical protein